MEIQPNILITIVLMLPIYVLIRLICNTLALHTIIKYSGIDEIDFLKQDTSAKQAEVLTVKFAEKVYLLNYRTLKALRELKEVEYLTEEEYEKQKNELLSNIEQATTDHIFVPKTNPKLLQDLFFFPPKLFSEFKEIATEQEILRNILKNVMPRIFNYKSR